MNTPSTVLIVDDMESGRKMLGNLLEPSGYRLHYASSGEEALSLVTQIEPDVILLDAMMPGMDGFQVCQQIRATPALAEIPILMVTTLDDDKSRLLGLEVGADDFISKPFRGAELRARVQTITRLNRHRRLVAERAKFAWAIAQARDGYIILDSEDRIQYANTQARQYLRLMPNSIGTRFLDSVASLYQCQPAEAWASWNTSPESTVRYLIQPETSASRAFWLQVDSLTLPSDTTSERLVCLRDVTEVMVISHVQTSYGETLMHKMRTPLQVILASLELLSAEDSPSAYNITVLAQSALEHTRKLYGQIESLLSYMTTKPFASQDNAFHMANLPALVEQTATNLKLSPAQVDVSPESASTWIVLSQPAMEILLWQVMDNAQKFHPQHSPSIQITATLENNQAVVRIADDGLTLTPDQLARVWTPYYQAEKYFTGQVEGMGLGLPQVALLVWGVGGTCTMYNRRDGAGIIVEFILPLAQVRD